MLLERIASTLFVYLLTKYCAVKSQPSECPVNATWGYLEVGDKYTKEQNDTSFIITGNHFTCYGKITEWKFYESGICHNITFQIYRPTITGEYILVGDNELIYNSSPGCSAGILESFKVPSALQLPIQEGDFIGWKDVSSILTNRMPRYVQALSGSSQYEEVKILKEQCPVGESCDWSSAKVVVRRYDLQATLDALEAPFIDNLNATISVNENQQAGLKIYKVVGSSNRNYNQVVQPDITYAIIDNNGDFTINKDTGVVSTAVVLDYESILENPVKLNITVSQGPYNSTGILVVNVIDVNEPHAIDNLPNVIVVDVAAPKNPIYTITTTDEDQLPNNWPDKVHLLVNDNPAADLFTINVTSGEITQKEDLTHWTGASVVTLFISVTDYYFTTTPLTLTIVLENIREPPYLVNLPNVVTLSETIGAGVIFDVIADCDVRSSLVNFEIIAVYPAQVAPPKSDPFFIDTFSNNHPTYTGQVSYTGTPKFDYMEVQKYEIEIVLKDDMFTSPAENLTVEIKWVNEAPQFEELSYGITTLPELSPIGTLLPGVDLKANDVDLILGDWMDYIITYPNQSLFDASNVTHKVSVIGKLTCPPGVANVRYEILVNLHDAAGAEAAKTATVTLDVTDINDHAPQFAKSYYEGSVSEWSQDGTIIVTVDVTDDDADDNAKISFVVLEDFARIYFEASTCNTSPCRGNILLKQPISHVDYPNITFTLVAFDHGAPSLNDTTTVFVEVIDENDHPPEFVNEYYNLEEQSEMDVGSSVVQVEINDLDTDINSNVTFLLLIPESSFGIDSETGIVRSKTELQAYKTHILYAYARDFTRPKQDEFMSDPCVVQINTFTGKHHLVDIHMEIALKDFLTMKEEFLRRLNLRLSPWYAKQDKNLLYPYQSILTIYALSRKPSESVDDLGEEKTFIDRNGLLSALRVNIPGKPQDWLRGPEFAEYQVFKVLPTYPVWLIDTIGGIVTLTLLCTIFLIFWILLFCFIFGGWKKKTKVSPQVLFPDTEQYELRYGNYTHVPYPKEPPNFHHKKKKGILPSPIVGATVTPKNQGNKNSVSELPEMTKTTSVIPNKPLPPSGQHRNI